MTKVGRAGLMALLLVSAAGRAMAQERHPGLEALEARQPIVLVDEDGRELEGRVGKISGDSLQLLTGDGAVDLALDRIVRIDHPRDGLGNGALIGMTATVGLTLIAYVAGDFCDSQGRHCSRPPAWAVLWASGSSAAIGAGIGVAIDAMITRRDRTIYRRGAGWRATVAPAIGPGVGGAVLSFSW